MNKLFLYYFFISAFLSLVLVAAYALLLAGGKYNGEQLTPDAIYERARYGSPTPMPDQRSIDEGLIQKSEQDRLNDQNLQVQQETPALNASPMPVASPMFTGSDGVPYKE